MASSSDLSAFRGLCPAPFLDETKFPSVGGNVAGRFCAPVPQLSAGLTCCLPCPVTEWIYPPSFFTWIRVAQGFSVVSIVICVLLMISWIILPPEKTRRHYLSICLVCGIIMMATSFVIALGAKPNQCYNAITPHDMYSDVTCAFSGAFLIAGGLSVTVWIFIRALSMHLQICWDIVPGRRFFFASQAAGWGVAAVLLIVTIAVTGVTYRFGDTCLVKSGRHGLADFWGPLLGIAGAAGLIQILTFVYCLKVYIQNMWSDEKTETNTSTGLPSYTSSIRAHSVRAVYRRMKKVLWLQWRSIMIVIFLLVDIIFFSIVWITLDKKIERAVAGDIANFMPFLLCLFSSSGDRSQCYAKGEATLINESTAIAILMLLSLTGVQTGLMLSRSAMFSAWGEVIMKRFRKDKEFVSLDAKRFSSDQRTFELLKIGSPMSPSDTEAQITTPHQTYSTDMRSPEYLNDSNIDASNEKRSPVSPVSPPGTADGREWRKPTMSFAGPQAPSNAAGRMNWEQPMAPRSRGGLGLHPPQSPSPNTALDVQPYTPNSNTTTTLHNDREDHPNPILKRYAEHQKRIVDEALSVHFDVDSSNQKAVTRSLRHFI